VEGEAGRGPEAEAGPGPEKDAAAAARRRLPRRRPAEEAAARPEKMEAAVRQWGIPDRGWVLPGRSTAGGARTAVWSS
jgi:hypothetical protein